MAKTKTIILGVTGGIAAYKACELISKFKDASLNVRVILTKEAEKFITALTLQTLSGNKVITDMFEVPEEWDVSHVSAANEADLILITPATANVIGKLANGICDDMLTCTVLASKAPVLIAPAMNDKMYSHPMVAENIAKLKKIGYKFVGPVKGRLACGRNALGHIATADDIVKEARRLLK